MITIHIQPGLNRIGALSMEAIAHGAQQMGYPTFILPANGIVDRASFFDAVRATLPLDPPLISSNSWDALSDSLWEGLHTHSARRIVIIWPRSRQMANSAPAEFEIALSVLTEVANLLADPNACNNPKELIIAIE